MVRSRCNATVASATDRDVAGRGSAAGTATDSNGVAVRECADVDKQGSAVAAIRRDNAMRAAPAPAASYDCCSSCCFDHDPDRCCCDCGSSRCCCGCDPSRCYVETAAAVANRLTAAGAVAATPARVAAVA